MEIWINYFNSKMFTSHNFSKTFNDLHKKILEKNVNFYDNLNVEIIQL